MAAESAAQSGRQWELVHVKLTYLTIEQGERLRRIAYLAAIIAIFGCRALAFETVALGVSGGSEGLRDDLINSSLVVQARRDEINDTQELMAAARSDYARLLSVLYDQGFFGPVISIRVDGREAGEISPLSPPETITRIDIRVDAGPRFRFGDLSIEPLAPGTELPDGFARGQTARTAIIEQTARRGVRGWRDLGYAQADVSNQRIVADHDADLLNADLEIAPGPQLRFGELNISGNEDVTTRRIRKIAGLPTGELVTPDAVAEVSENVRRTGSFRSVVLEPAGVPNPDGTLDMNLRVIEQLPRRFGFGAEYSNTDGIELSAFWLHRNLLGGAERLQIGATVTGIGATNRDPGLEFSARLTRPASPRPDTDVFIVANLGLLDERDYSGENFELGFGWQRRFSERLTGEIGFSANAARIDDFFGESQYRFISFPGRLTFDGRNDFVAPTNGFYLDTQVTPFLSLRGTSDGARFYGDLRGYEDFLDGDRLVLAGRVQIGSLVGPDLENTPNYLLFYSGGGGTVRGQEFEALGVDLPGGGRTGGRAFLGYSLEARYRVTDAIEAVAFYDWGYIGAESFPDGSGTSHAGAGVGVRYITPIGPLRVDLGTPVSGPESDSTLLLYIGIGQAF